MDPGPELAPDPGPELDSDPDQDPTLNHILYRKLKGKVKPTRLKAYYIIFSLF